MNDYNDDEYLELRINVVVTFILFTAFHYVKGLIFVTLCNYQGITDFISMSAVNVMYLSIILTIIILLVIYFLLLLVIQALLGPDDD